MSYMERPWTRIDDAEACMSISKTLVPTLGPLLHSKDFQEQNAWM